MKWRVGFLLLLVYLSPLPSMNACTSASSQELKLTDDSSGDDEEDGDEETLVDDTVETSNDTALEKQSAAAKPFSTPVPRPKPKGVYPFPKSFNLFEFDNFLETNRGLYTRYMPLQKEYDLYFKTLNETDDVSSEAVQSIKKRVLENDERAHWVWIYGLNELVHFLYDNSRQMLRVDLEENFAARMKVISYLADALKEAKKNPKYIDLTRTFYVAVNERYLGRQVKPRQKD